MKYKTISTLNINILKIELPVVVKRDKCDDTIGLNHINEIYTIYF